MPISTLKRGHSALAELLQGCLGRNRATLSYDGRMSRMADAWFPKRFNADCMQQIGPSLGTFNDRMRHHHVRDCLLMRMKLIRIPDKQRIPGLDDQLRNCYSCIGKTANFKNTLLTTVYSTSVRIHTVFNFIRPSVRLQPSILTSPLCQHSGSVLSA